MITNIADTNFATSFEIDKICGTFVGSYNASDYNTAVGGGGFQNLYIYNIPHTFTRPVFVDMLTSVDNAIYVPQGFALSNTEAFIAYSDASNIYLLNTDNSSTTYYYWITCTWINNYDATNPLIVPTLQSVEDNTSLTTFDSRQNYQKILSQNVQTYSNSTTSATVAHNLGYTPNYKIYFESLSGQVWPNIGNSSNSLFIYTLDQALVDGYVDTSNLNLKIQGGSEPNLRVWPRIYFDQ